ncbi:hypothetical protein PanWU01x14_249220, partial [Parasponia andersonii]
VHIAGLLKDSISKANVKVFGTKIGRLLKVDKRSMGLFFANKYVQAKVEVQLRAESGITSCFSAKDLALKENMEESIAPVEMEELALSSETVVSKIFSVTMRVI